MKKIFPVILITVLLSGCFWSAKQTVKKPDEIKPKPMDGLVTENHKGWEAYDLISSLLGIHGNLSSLFVDKTADKLDGYTSKVVKKLDEARFIYILPPKIVEADGSYAYNTDLQRLIRNYMAIGKFCLPSEDVDSAEYVAVTVVTQSPDRTHGTNTSKVTFSILDKTDFPMYAATIQVSSSSDSNYWYNSEKSAHPVSELTVKAISYILANGLPEAHSNPNLFKTEAENYSANGGNK